MTLCFGNKRNKRDKEDSQLSGFSSRKVVVSFTKRKKYCSFGFVSLLSKEHTSGSTTQGPGGHMKLRLMRDFWMADTDF